MELNSLLILFLLGLVLYLFFNRSSRDLPLPPGPKKLPLLGNALDIPMTLAEQVYHRFARELDSDVIHLSAAGQDLIILDSFQANWDLLEKRSATFSSRPRLPMVNELMGWEWNLIFQPYGDDWRVRRKLFVQTFNEAAVKGFRPVVLKATHQFIGQLLDNPERFMAHINHLAAKIVMSVAYGIDIQPEDDPYVDLIDRANQTIIRAVAPGAYFVDAFPILKHVPAWFPGANFKRQAREWKKLCLDSVHIPFKAAKKLIDDGTGQQSFTSLSLADADKLDRERHEQIVAQVASSMYGAGTDTTSAVIATFFLTMLLNPQVQATAQAELDRVLTPGHLPTFDDEPSLPFVTAVLLEVLRWSPVAPIGLPHRLIADDTYKGYHLPKGALVIANLWALSRDEDMYPEPERFNPYRFLKDGEINVEIRDPRDLVFGFGRRICPGRHMAFATVWMTIATVLSVMEISKIPGAPDPIIDDKSIFRRPKPFKCSIKPRSASVAELLRASLWSHEH